MIDSYNTSNIAKKSDLNTTPVTIENLEVHDNLPFPEARTISFICCDSKKFRLVTIQITYLAIIDSKRNEYASFRTIISQELRLDLGDIVAVGLCNHFMLTILHLYLNKNLETPP